MKIHLFIIACAAIPLMTSCQSVPGSAAVASPSMSVSTGGKGAAAASPFNPSGPLISARYEPPDRYYGFGGGYSKSRPVAAGEYDENNFLYSSDRCRHYHYHRSSAYCGGPAWGGYAHYSRAYPVYCSSGYGHRFTRW